MNAQDLPSALRLWADSAHIELAEGDAAESLARYLSRNPGISQVALDGNRLAGAVLAGHDGRRGLLYHLAVAEDLQGQGIGRALVERCLSALKAESITRALILVARENQDGARFWASMKWEALSFAMPMGTDL